ncbi:dephospho-CoA kinase [Pseudolysobacter antarcticus]|uniref:dephospho-CoA kinase n=1 Tax=Pseudolysobacter antarcticus TaxID=2511995 RepID=UPI001F5DA45B|nr:dephospho-CoA kinase [Pseudolysobacter antarcticus]
MNSVAVDRGRLVVVITGGIASGKSAVSRQFEQLGMCVHDADLIARELVAPGQPALLDITRVFGSDAITATGELDRKYMRERVFANPQLRHELEAILHPGVRDELHARVRRDATAYSILAIPLLVESAHDYDWINRVLVIDVPESLQIERLLQRDGVTVELAQQILAAQASRSARLARADDVIENTGTLEELNAAVEQLHQRYLTLVSH